MQDFTEQQIREAHVGRMVHMLSHQMSRHMPETDMSGDGLTVMQKHVLKFILMDSLQRDVYQKDVEEEFQIRRSTATGILQLMEKNGYIRRESDKRDGRLKKITPTEKAEALRPDILEHIRWTEELLTAGIPEEELFVCKRTIYRMCQNLNQSK